MLAKFEEDLIHEALDTIFYNIKKVPIDDFAYFLAKNDPKLAEKLSDWLNFIFLDGNMKNDKKN